MLEVRVIPGLGSLISGCFDKEAIEAIGNCEAPYREFIYEHSVNGLFILGATFTAHEEFTARNGDHFWFDDCDHRLFLNRAGNRGSQRTLV